MVNKTSSETLLEHDDLMIGRTVQLVSAHLGNNSVANSEIPALLKDVFKALVTLGSETAETSNGLAPPTDPAVPIKKSVTPDHIICLEDGKKLKMLKRHLRTSFNLSPEQYRERWKLPQDYPMVAPNYAAKRSALAKDIGLGNRKA